MLMEEFRKPFFEIIEVIEPRGRSMADIVKEVAARRKVSVREMRSGCFYRYITQARQEAYRAIRSERPDITSGQIAIFFNREGSTIRHHFRQMGMSTNKQK